jgi:hypothetical protein
MSPRTMLALAVILTLVGLLGLGRLRLSRK